jgi:hypothetical protein
MGEPINTQAAGVSQSAQQASGSTSRQISPQDFNAYAPSGGVAIMTYNPSTITPGAKGQADQQGMMTTQRFDDARNVNQLRAAIAKLETGKGNRGDQVRVAIDGQGWNEATPMGEQALSALRQVAGNWSAPGRDQVVANAQPRSAQTPAPAPTSPLNLPKP